MFFAMSRRPDRTMQQTWMRLWRPNECNCVLPSFRAASVFSLSATLLWYEFYQPLTLQKWNIYNCLLCTVKTTLACSCPNFLLLLCKRVCLTGSTLRIALMKLELYPECCHLFKTVAVHQFFGRTIASAQKWWRISSLHLDNHPPFFFSNFLSLWIQHQLLRNELRTVKTSAKCQCLSTGIVLSVKGGFLLIIFCANSQIQ